MGSLPPESMDSYSASASSSKQALNLIDETTLLNLFKSQQNHLNFFFNHIDHSQTLAFTRTLLNSAGTIFFSGVGKSGFVAHKISQTLVSLGIRSAFLSPVDALHGDIGILTNRDVIVLFSKSGTTEELIRLVPCVKAKGAFLISVTSVEGNALAGMCDMNVHLPVERELCPFNLAPVTSTAIQMVFGDTVAIALMGARKLSKEEYAGNHPAGKIGKSLIFKVGLWFFIAFCFHTMMIQNLSLIINFIFMQMIILWEKEKRDFVASNFFVKVIIFGCWGLICNFLT